METKYFIGIGIVVVVLLAILFMPGAMAPEEEKGPETIDCGSDMLCFMEAGVNCTAAKVLTDTRGNKGTLEILGEENGICSTTLTINAVNIDSPDFDAYTQEIKDSAKAWEGKSMTCSAPIDAADFAGEDTLSLCDGSLKAAVQETTALIEAYAAKLAAVSTMCIPQTLWNFEETRYVVHGLDTKEGKDMCHVTYTFEADGKTGLFTIDHYFNKESELVEVNYTAIPVRSGDVSGWCSGDGWTSRSAAGIVSASAPIVVEHNTKNFCQTEFTILPTTPELVGANAVVWLDSENKTALSMDTTLGNTIERVFTIEEI